MVQAYDKLSLSGSARKRWVEGRTQDQLGLLARMLVSTRGTKASHTMTVPRLWKYRALAA